MSKGHYLGEFESLVLLALLRLGEDAYGLRVRQEIEARTARKASIGAVYATLERLEAKALVRSQWGEPSSERGGRAKRYFAPTAQGLKALREAQASLAQMLDGLTIAAVRS